MCMCAGEWRVRTYVKMQHGLLAALAIAPMMIGGAAIRRHPIDAMYDSSSAPSVVLLERTLWKYT